MPDGRSAEPFGDERLLRAQLQLHVDRSHLRALPGTFEQGRTFGLVNVSPSEIAERIASARFPERLLVHAEERCSDEITDRLAGLGYRVSAPLALMTGAAPVVASRCQQILEGGRLEGGLCYVGITQQSPPSLVRGVQELQSICGITPLPGWYLRGVELPVLTVAIVDSRGAPIGVGSVQDIGSAGSDARSAVGLAICVAEQHRGRGLGTLLNSRLLADGLMRFGSGRVQEIVDDPASGSMRMNERCGLRRDPASHYLFAELGSPDRRGA